MSRRFVFSLVCCLFYLGASTCFDAPVAARADENLLGLPAPRDPQHPGAVVLHGGKLVSSDVVRRFAELAGGAKARIVVVPSAGYREGDYSSEAAFKAVINSRYSGWRSLQTSGRIESFQFLYTDNPDDADDPAFVRPLASATGVWFSGGLQRRLNYRFVGEFPRQTRFQQALRGVIERGGVVGGTSAGMAALPEIMTLYQDREHSDAPAAAVAAHGFGLLSRAIVEQHFDGKTGRLERFTGLLGDSAQLDRLAGRAGAGREMLGLAVEERTALIVRGDELNVLGTGRVHVFVKSDGGRTTAWHQLQAGETALLKRDPAAARDVVLVHSRQQGQVGKK